MRFANGKRLRAGFTLFEVMLTIAMIAFLSSLTFIVFEAFDIGNNMAIATESLASAYRQAEQSSRAVDGDRTWGVRVSSTAITLFKGSSYSARDVNYDETTVLGSIASVTGTVEVVFGKLSGTPPSAVSTTLIGADGDTRTVTINAKGTVDY